MIQVYCPMYRESSPCNLRPLEEAILDLFVRFGRELEWLQRYEDELDLLRFHEWMLQSKIYGLNFYMNCAVELLSSDTYHSVLYH